MKSLGWNYYGPATFLFFVLLLFPGCESLADTRSDPGGAEIIYAYAGRDATEAYLEVHEPNLITSTLSPEEHIGELDPATALPDEPPSKPERSQSGKPPLETFINVYDFEDAARQSLSEKSWTFISGASNDNVSRDVRSALPLNLSSPRRSCGKPVTISAN
jgi:hypothetical protein